MSYEKKEGQGSLFVNDKKNDKQPDFVGEGLFEGKTIKISAWKKVSKGGKHYLSLSLQKPLESEKNKTKSDNADPFGDEVPW